MRTYRQLIAIAATTMMAATVTAPAIAQDPEKCQPMTLKSDDTDRSIKFIDIQNDGANQGDWRIGVRRLLDEEGKEIGYRRWAAIALDAPPGEGERSEVIAHIVLKLPDGQIHIQTFIDTSRPVDTTDASVLAEDAQGNGVVIGGTGAYLFARGSYASTRDGETRTYMLNIKCD